MLVLPYTKLVLSTSDSESVLMGCHSESAWRRSFSSPSRITNTSERDGSGTGICVVNDQVVRVGSAEEGQMF